MIVPPGLKRGANRRLAGEDVRKGAIVLPAGRRLAAQDVALAAAVGLTRLDGAPPRARRAVLDRRRDRRARHAAAATPRSTTPTAICSRGMLERLGADVTDLGILQGRSGGACRARSPRPRKDHDLVLTSGGVSTGEADHVRDAVEKIGKLVFWRVAIKPGRPVAMGVVPGASAATARRSSACRAIRSRRSSPSRAWCGRCCCGSPARRPEPLTALPVRLAFAYKKKTGRREYVRVALRRAADGTIEAVKHPQEGAGVITSLTETDGLAELAEDATTVEPGATVGFLSYATLMG